MSSISKHGVSTCRWCGLAPKVEDPEPDDEDEIVTIVCSNQNCTVMPSIGAMGMDYAVETWNRGAGV